MLLRRGSSTKKEKRKIFEAYHILKVKIQRPENALLFPLNNDITHKISSKSFH